MSPYLYDILSYSSSRIYDIVSYCTIEMIIYCEISKLTFMTNGHIIIINNTTQGDTSMRNMIPKILLISLMLLLTFLLISCQEAEIKNPVGEGSESNGEATTPPIEEVEGSQGLKFTSNKDGTCYVAGMGTCQDTHVIIPTRSPEGELVTAIGKAAFSKNEKLEKVTIHSAITHIMESAFDSCGYRR